MPVSLSQPAAKLALAAEVLQRSGSIELRVWGTSMLPSIWPGDVLKVESTAKDEVAPGDIVLVHRDERFLVHRLVEKRGRECRRVWITKGDSAPHVDPPATEAQLLGRVVNISGGDRDLKPSRRISSAHSAIAFLACHSNRFRSVLLRLHSLSVSVSVHMQRVVRPGEAIRRIAAVCCSDHPGQ